MKTAALIIARPYTAIAGFAQRHPWLKTLGLVLIVANEVRGFATVALYLKTFGLALPS